MPITDPDNSFIIELAWKIAGAFVTFVGGIVTATWVVSGKIRGFDDRLKSVENTQSTCPGKTLVKIDEKLDRIHERIDEILLNNKK